MSKQEKPKTQYEERGRLKPGEDFPGEFAEDNMNNKTNSARDQRSPHCPAKYIKK